MLVLAPASVQEAVELTQKAFDLADKYRNPPCSSWATALIGQMMEPVDMPEYKPDATPAGKDLGRHRLAARLRPRARHHQLACISSPSALEEHVTQALRPSTR